MQNYAQLRILFWAMKALSFNYSFNKTLVAVEQGQVSFKAMLENILAPNMLHFHMPNLFHWVHFKSSIVSWLVSSYCSFGSFLLRQLLFRLFAYKFSGRKFLSLCSVKIWKKRVGEEERRTCHWQGLPSFTGSSRY